MGQSIKEKQQNFLKKLRKEVQFKNKQLLNIKQIHKDLIKQVIYQNKNSKNSKIQALIYLNYKTFKCLECLQTFDSEQKKPIMVCPRQHTLCKDCFERKIEQKKRNCQECSMFVKDLGTNRNLKQIINKRELIFSLVSQEYENFLDESGVFQPNSGVIKRRKIHIQKFSNYKQFLKISNDLILKTNLNDQWISIRSKQIIKPYQIIEVRFKVVNSYKNKIIVGITKSKQDHKKKLIFDQSLFLNLQDRQDINNLPNIQIKNPYARTYSSINFKNASLSMIVDRFQSKITWKINNKIFKIIDIPLQYFKNQFHIFLSIFHYDDMIVLNQFV